VKDQKETIQELKNKMRKFSRDRNWEQFHTPKNLSICMAIEVGELMEYFRFTPDSELDEVVEKNRQDIEHEIADVALLLLQFCNMNNIDLTSAIHSKLEELEQRYTVEKSHGRSTKIKK
jgi:NTP pyrophosphatase (non-canonical NTP hydrolase)